MEKGHSDQKLLIHHPIMKNHLFILRQTVGAIFEAKLINNNRPSPLMVVFDRATKLSCMPETIIGIISIA